MFGFFLGFPAALSGNAESGSRAHESEAQLEKNEAFMNIMDKDHHSHELGNESVSERVSERTKEWTSE